MKETHSVDRFFTKSSDVLESPAGVVQADAHMATLVAEGSVVSEQRIPLRQ